MFGLYCLLSKPNSGGLLLLLLLLFWILKISLLGVVPVNSIVFVRVKRNLNYVNVLYC